MKINGVEIPDIDNCDLAAMEKYEAAHARVLEKANKTEEVCTKRSEAIRFLCEAVFEFFETVFGEGTAKLVFGDQVNLRVCMDAYEEVSNSVKMADEAFSAKYINKYGGAKKNGGKIYPNPNYYHKKKKKRR